MTVRVVITGSRFWRDPQPIWRKLDGLWRLFDGDVEAAVGDCPTGVDKAVALWSEMEGVPVETYVADWARYGDYAGPERNGRMVKSHVAEMGLAFLGAPPSLNKGTNNCIWWLE